MAEIDLFKEFLRKRGLYNLPASTRFHGAYAGGLADHCSAVYEEFLNLNEHWGLGLTAEQAYCLCYAHDLCKTEAYCWDENGKPTYKKGFDKTRHGSLSLLIAQEFPFWDELLGDRKAEIEDAILWHMSIWTSDQGDVVGGLKQAIATNNVAYCLQVADMYASRVKNT